MKQSNLNFYFQAKVVFLTIFFSISGFSNIIWAQDEEEDKTLSPYFFVKCEDPEIDQMPLKETSAEVNICGVIADVIVRQTYCNVGTTPLEAIYVFPGSTRAAVYAMQMHVGNRILIAKIKEKEEARQEYEEAKEEGKTASLLEQERPNVFQMNVANILPGDTIVVEMKYTELLVPTEGKYEFVYPTVVGPRYTTGGEEWNANPYQHEGELPLYKFNISVRLNAGMSIQEMKCLSHDIMVHYEDGQHALCSLSDITGLQGNRDFILHYSMADNAIETGLLLFEGEEENFFLAMIQPPPRPTIGQIPPREYVFIMDVSGSMHGFPLDISKALMEDLLFNLRPYDKFNVLFFAGGSAILSENGSLDANPANISSAVAMINSQTGGGGTVLLPALQRVLALEGTEDYARCFVIATDGYVTVEKEAFDLIRNNLNNANFFPFGIGSATNRYIIEGMAHIGMTEPVIITNAEDAPEMGEKFREYIQYPVLTNISCSYSSFDVYDVEPISIPDALAERPLIIFGKWNGEAEGSITLTGTTGNNEYSETIQVNQYTPDKRNEALKYLWARYRIQLLEDYGSVSWDEDHKQEIINLGLKYNLLTQYTSFVAIDSVIRNESDTSAIVTQPLPLPEGVSDYAVGDGLMWNATFTEALTSRSYGKSTGTRLINVYPNPFTSKTTLKVFLDENDNEKCKVIRIYNILGEVIFEKDISGLEEGEHEVEVDFDQLGIKLSDGIYYAKLIIDHRINSTYRLHYLP